MVSSDPGPRGVSPAEEAWRLAELLATRPGTTVVAEGDAAEELIGRVAAGMPADVQRQLRFVTFGVEPPQSLAALPCPWVSAQRLLSEAECEAIDAFAFDRAGTWFADVHPGSGDISEWNGVSLGLAYEWLFAQYLLEAAKDATVLHNILGSWDPGRVILVTGSAASRLVFETLCREGGVPFESVAVPGPPRGSRAGETQGQEAGGRALWPGMMARLATWVGRVWSGLEALDGQASRGSPLRILEDWPFHQEAARRGHEVHRNVFFLFWHQSERLELRFYDGSRGGLRGAMPPLGSDDGASARAAFTGRWALVEGTVAKSFRCNGIDLWAVVRPELTRIFTEEFPRLAGWAENLAYVLERHRVDLTLLSLDCLPPQRIAAMASHLRGIPSVYLPHGILSFRRDCMNRPVADRVAAWGPALADRYALGHRSLAPGQVAVTGNPKFDVLAETPPRERADIRRALGIGPQERMVLFVTELPVQRFSLSAFNPMDHAILPLLYALQATADRPDLHLILRPRPDEDPAPLRARVKAAGRPDVRIATEWPLYDILCAADVVLVRESTVGLEAMVCGKPVIVLRVAGTREIFPYASEGAAPLATGSAELLRHLEAVLDDGPARDDLLRRQKSFVVRHAGPIDGKALDRVASLIEESVRLSHQVGREVGTWTGC
ncbi:MAG: hypothetical protein HY724_03640 [Candidatus Rokubacteria bacterium]|nr:hypothetical protein [Candidatus Rokubacteria bacterium]